MLDKPDSLINSSDISMVAQYNLGPTAEPSEESSGNLEIRINWLEGYNDFGPRTGRIELIRSPGDKGQVSYRLETEIGTIVRYRGDAITDLGTSCELTDLKGLYITENPGQEFRHNADGAFRVSAYVDGKLVGTHTQRIYYSHFAKAYYTLIANGIPAIPSPLENRYAFFSLLRLDDMSLDALLSRFGNRYTKEEYYGETLYIYDYGLVLSQKGDGNVSRIYLGDECFAPGGNMVRKADLMEDGGLETAVLYEWNGYYGLYVGNESTGAYVNEMLGFTQVYEWELADLAGDSRPEIYISGSGYSEEFRCLFTVKNGKLEKLFSPLDEMGQHSRITCELKGKQLTVAIAGETGKMSCTLPDRLFPECGGLDDSSALSLGSDWKPAERNGQRLIRLTCTVRKKVGEYYHGPLGDVMFPEYMIDFYADVAWATLWLKHDGLAWQVIDSQLSMRYGDGTGDDVPPIAYDEARIGPGHACGGGYPGTWRRS
ncbi:MAG: hypothetical protein GX027_04750 [Clostridiaceae bacterium]|jgi:hypothetical protein|nr:hypothetical protein [Clostridiaceae bacterium]